MGLFGFDTRKTDNSQTYLDQKSAATEGSLIGGYGEGSTTAGGAILTGGETGSQVSLYAPESYVSNDPQVAIIALRQQRKLADSFISAGEKKDDLLASILKSQTEMAQDIASGGETGRNKTMLIVTLAVLSLVGWIFWKR